MNKALLQSALHRCKKVTLDIDATEIAAGRAGAPSSNDSALAFVGHCSKSGSNGTTIIGKAERKPSKTIGTSARSTKGV